MPYRRRLHIQAGTYYVVQLGGAQQQLFSRPEHYKLFEGLLAGAARRTHTKVLAYCWLPRSVHLALQAGHVPIGRFLQGFTASYARAIHHQAHESGHLFAQRYRGALVDPGAWLAPLLRYIHYLPVLAELATEPGAWPHSSHRAYLRERRIAWLHTREPLRVLAPSADVARAYAALMSRPPSAEEVRLFELGSRADPQIIGDDVFIDTLPRAGRNVRPRMTFEQIVHVVARLLDVERSQLFSSSHRRELVLARAVIAWHVTERGITTASDVARQFRRHPSTISVAIERYRRRRPELFRLDALSLLIPMR